VSPLETLLEQGLAAHRRGDLAVAAAAYREVLASDPGQSLAQHHLGLIEFADNPADGWPRLEAALAAADARPDFSLNTAGLLARAGQDELALACLQRGHARFPADENLLAALADALHQAGRDAEAVALCTPHPAPGLRLALAAYNLAVALYHQGDPRAESYAQRALACCRRIEERLPPLNLLAALARRQGQFAAGLGRIDQALALKPGDADSLCHRAALLRDLFRLDEALICIDRALKLKPDSATGWNVRGNILLDQRRDLDAALACFEQALKLVPTHTEARFNRGLCRLHLGELVAGFNDYEARIQLPGAAPLYPKHGLPRWQGEDLRGRRLLLVAEQGNGDTLQFIRLAQWLPADCEIHLLAQPGLVRLLARNPELASVRPLNAPPPAADFVLPLLSLPQRLGLSLADLARPWRRLNPDPADLAHWQQWLAALPRPRIGLVWAGDSRPQDPESHRIDRRRSLHFRDFAPLLDLPGPQFISLQKGAPAAQASDPRLLDPTADLPDFAATAALVSQLDLVISVDTAVAHLAANLGRPTWLLSRHDGCWRWLHHRDDSPWYPELRLFRQTRPGDWPSVLASVRDALILEIGQPQAFND
jgi:tetratricopeptide (TPR) repeat protein